MGAIETMRRGEQQMQRAPLKEQHRRICFEGHNQNTWILEQGECDRLHLVKLYNKEVDAPARWQTSEAASLDSSRGNTQYEACSTYQQALPHM